MGKFSLYRVENIRMQAQFIKYLYSKNRSSDSGFTLIELLVVVIVIGVLAAIALPNMLGQVGKARQSEAKTYLGTINRSQQSYFAEHGSFAKTITELGVDIPKDTTNYSYTIEDTAASQSIAIAKPAEGRTHKGYLAAAALVNTNTNPSVRTALCESKGSGSAAVLTESDVAIAADSIGCTGKAVEVK
jgi:type IV pilus assembly protein PilA